MDWKLNVDVHVAAGDDGLMLVVGGLVRPLSGQDLETILRGKPVKQRRKISKREPAQKKVAENKQLSWRAKKAKAGICAWCERKAAPGKRLCRSHIVSSSERIAEARAAKKTASGKKVAA